MLRMMRTWQPRQRKQQPTASKFNRQTRSVCVSLAAIATQSQMCGAQA